MRLLIAFLKAFWTRLNDWALNIETENAPIVAPPDWPRWRGQPVENSVHCDNHTYTSPDYRYLRGILRQIALQPHDIFYDIGAGKGRMLCLVARRRVRKCVGVELLPELCEVARRNAQRLRGRIAPIEIVCGDAARANLSGGTVYFLFNPFGKETMADVLANLQKSLIEEPRVVTLIYFNPIHAQLLLKSGWLTNLREFKILNGTEVTIWRNSISMS